MQLLARAFPTYRAAAPLILCLFLGACDPTFNRVRRFRTPDLAAYPPLELAQLDQIAEEHNFSSDPNSEEANVPFQDAEYSPLASYYASIREPNWGSCGLVLLRDATTDTVELRVWAFPSSSEPVHLQRVRQALEALLFHSGYVANE